jgi:Peptidase C26
MMTYHVVSNDHQIQRMMKTMASFKGENVPPRADVIIFPGGADINPTLYGDVRHPTTGGDERRDKMFFDLWSSVAGLKSLKVGICGGGQFLNVMYGGRMYQDVDNHAIHGSHEIFYRTHKDGLPIEDHTSYTVTSTHHQMMIPGKDAEVWGYTQRSTYRDCGHDRRRPSDFGTDGPDMEIIFYPKYRTLCFQPHPEYNDKSCRELFSVCLMRALREIG